MPSPTEIRLTLGPGGRFDVIDVAGRIRAELGDVLQRHRGALYCSLHTTAGYLDQRLVARLRHHQERLSLFFKAFGAVFPPDAAYGHDQMHLRAELSDAQRAVEPRNGDSHLTFIGAGMRNCVTYRNRAAVAGLLHRPGRDEPGDLPRAHDERGRLRPGRRWWSGVRLTVPTLAAPHRRRQPGRRAAGPLRARSTSSLARAGIEKGRVDIALEPSERNVGLTVNEYETLLMQHDLREVLQNPLQVRGPEGSAHARRPPGHPGQDASTTPATTWCGC